MLRRWIGQPAWVIKSNLMLKILYVHFMHSYSEKSEVHFDKYANFQKNFQE